MNALAGRFVGEADLALDRGARDLLTVERGAVEEHGRVALQSFAKDDEMLERRLVA